VNIAVAVLTYNRKSLFERTLASLKRTSVPYDLVLVDGGSTDGTAEMVAGMGGYCYTEQPSWIGATFHVAVELALETKPDLIMFTGDDYEYRIGWLEDLAAFWRKTLPAMALVSCHIEPAFRWNKVYGMLELNNRRALVRATLGGANWSFRPELWPLLKELVPKGSHKYDKDVCRKLYQQRYLCCAMDLAEHIGEGHRVWMDGPEPQGEPVDLVYWGLV